MVPSVGMQWPRARRGRVRRVQCPLARGVRGKTQRRDAQRNPCPPVTVSEAQPRDRRYEIQAGLQHHAERFRLSPVGSGLMRARRMQNHVSRLP